MPHPAYLTLKGNRQGLIAAGCNTKASIGNTYQSGHEDQILVQGFRHNIHVPSGGATASQRQHKPLIISKMVDKASPLLNTAMTIGERLLTCRLDFYRTADKGGLELYYTIEVQDALIVNIDALLPNRQRPENAELGMLEELHIAYRKIEWIHHVCSTMGTDQWRTPTSTSWA